MNNARILITGATGLVGKSVIRRLLRDYPDVTVLAMVRNREKAVAIFGEENPRLRYLVGDVCLISPEAMEVDYIIHGASQTASKAFIQQPVETILTAVRGTRNLLEIARLSGVKGFLYLSSMEVYGAPSTDEKIDENHGTDLKTMEVRTCYPESKRMCESLCASYASEYSVPARVLRLTQTFGPGVEYNDGRVFAEFARCAIEGRDIVLKTRGETRRNYLYTEDAVDAILTALVNGTAGEAYNAANEDTYCSIFEMATLVAEKCADAPIRVVIEDKGDARAMGYAPVLHMNLDTRKLQALGWKPACGLEDMFRALIEDMKKNR